MSIEIRCLSYDYCLNKIFTCYENGPHPRSVRKDVWLYLLGHYQFGDTSDARARADAAAAEAYAAACADCARLAVQGDAYLQSDLAFNTQVRNTEDGRS